MGPSAPLLLLFFLSWTGPLQGQQHHLVEYMERRLAALEERLAQCQDQSSRHAAELRDFKNKMLPLLEVAEKERETLRTEADSISGRVDRLEREVDYLETQNPALPCVELDEKVTGGPGAKGKGRRNEKYDMVTDCSYTVAQVRSMKILKRFGGSVGLWTKDPLGPAEKIYVLDGTQNDTAFVFPRLRDFTLAMAARKASRIRVPFPWICLEHSSCLSLPKQKDKQGMQKAPGTRELALENPAHAGKTREMTHWDSSQGRKRDPAQLGPSGSEKVSVSAVDSPQDSSSS